MLLVRGRMSDLVSEQKADEFLARFPEVEFVDVSGAGHMVAGDRNDAFAAPSWTSFTGTARHQGDRGLVEESGRRESNPRSQLGKLMFCL